MFTGLSSPYSNWAGKTLSLLLLAFAVAQESLALDAKGLANSNPLEAHMNFRYSGLPLSFESNQGQADRTVRFLSHGAGYSIVFKDREALLLLSRKRPGKEQPRQSSMFISAPGQARETQSDTIRMRLSGAKAGPQPNGEMRLPGTVNYFLGDDPAHWKTGISTFEKVKYTGVYPGVDLIYYGSRQQLEFDFEVASGADPKQIRVRFDGAHKLTVDNEGNLTIVGANGTISFRKPVIYQIAANNSRQSIVGSFQILSRKTVGFSIGSYDRTKPLIIDPILNYSTYLGGNSEATAIAVDSAGNAYVTGQALQGMPASGIQPSPASKTNSSFNSAFVAKFNNTGSVLIYCTYLSGSGNDSASGIAVDSSGSAYVAGATSSPNFPITAGAFQSKNPAVNGSGAALSTGFVAKINGTGTALDYSTYLGGTANNVISGIAVDSSGNAYVTGTTQATNFPITQGAFQSLNKASSTETGFVTKLNTTGNSLLYSTYLGGSVEDVLNGIAVDSAGNAYVVGGSTSTDFPTTQGAFQTVNKTDPANWSACLTKLNPAGTGLVYSTYFGGNGQSDALAIALDVSGDAFVTGFTNSTNFPISPYAFQPQFLGGRGFAVYQAFATEFDANGSDLVYSTYLGGYNPKWGICITPIGGISQSMGLGVAVDASGNTYVVGSTNQIDFPVSSSSLERTNRAADGTCMSAAFFSQINPGGTRLLYSTYLSGSGTSAEYQVGDSVNGIALDSVGNAYLAGSSVSIDFPTTQGAYQLSSGGTFVAQLNASEITNLTVPTIKLSSAVDRQNPTPPVTFTVQIQSASGKTPTGTVALSFSTGQSSNPMSPWTTIELDQTGTAVYTPSDWISVPKNIAVYYLGDTYNAPASLLTKIIDTNPPLPVAITVTANPNPVSYGAPVTFNVSVSDPSRKGIPAGSVLLHYHPDASIDFTYGTVTLDSSGNASLTVGSFPDVPYSENPNPSIVPPGAYSVTIDFTPSNLLYTSGTANYTENIPSLGVTPAPVIYPAAGFYPSAQTITITDSVKNAQINYTSNGVMPNYSDRYSSAFQVSFTQTITAVANAPGYLPSPPTSATYVIGPDQGSSTPQANEWAWLSGNNLSPSPGVFGQMGVSAAETTPGGRSSAVTWTDKSGNFWLFGNFAEDSTGYPGMLNDLWKFTPSTKQWTWMSGGSTFPEDCKAVGSNRQCYMPGVYGTFQTPAAGNTPGGRQNEVTWIDKNGNLWLFGGFGYNYADLSNRSPALNDLWEFNTSINQWAWMGGSSTGTRSSPDVYGVLGQPAAGNTPGSRSGAATWTDSSGNLWLFGGSGVDSTGTSGELNDLWMFNPAINEWTWVGGSSTIPLTNPIVCVTCSSPGVYGTRGVFAAENIPSGRSSAAIWTDKSGAVWLFGGLGVFNYSSPNGYIYGSEGYSLNDLWKFNPTTHQWAWMGGNTTSSGLTPGTNGVYGTLGIPSATNVPGGRTGEVTWIDNVGNLWLFGGSGYDSAKHYADLNDYWKFDTSIQEWTWMGGSSNLPCVAGLACRAAGRYGTLGTPAVANVPGGRLGEVTWTDKNGNLWLFGGWGYDATNTVNFLNDLWEFNPSANEWTWMGGSSTYPKSGGQFGMYDAPGFFATWNRPGSREYAAGWTDTAGNLWLFGGLGYNAIQSNTGQLSDLNDLWEYVPSSPAPAPSFAISASPLSATVPAGASGTSTIAVAVGGGFNSAVTLTASGQPVGVTVAFSPASISGAGASTMTMAVGSSVAVGTYTITVTGASGNSLQTAVVTLTVTTPRVLITPVVKVTPSSSSIMAAQAFTVTVTVSGGSGNPYATGSVTLSSGTYTSPAAALSMGIVAINVPAGTLAVGTGTLAATYTPDTNSFQTYNASTGTASVTVTAAVNPGFAISGTPVTLFHGATTGNTSAITITPIGGFTGTVALTAALTSSPVGAQYPPTFSLGSANSVNINGTTAGTATLTISTTALPSAALVLPKHPGVPWYAAGGTTLACLLLLGIPARRRNWQTMLGMVVLLIALAGNVLACGGGGSGSGGGGSGTGGGGGGISGTTAGIYTITVTGTSGSTTANGAVTLTVQ
jgi:N-acetylneuraminic acid mutarotase